MKPVVQRSWSYIKDLGDFIKKIKNISTISKDSILVTADVVGLYPSIPHDAGLKAQEKVLNNRTNKKFSTEDLVKMARFVLKNNYFEFKCNSSLKFTYESSKTSIPFLDLKVSLSNGDLSTDLHIKSTDRHQFLHYTSSHPDHTKRSIIYSKALRISRICSNKSDFLKHLESVKSSFEVRGYPKKLMEQEMEKMKFFKNGIG